MILSGWNFSTTWRAKRRITRIGMSAPRYQRSGSALFGRRGLLAMLPFYLARLFLREKLPQHVGQDAAVPVVMHLLRRVDADRRLERLRLLAGGKGADGDLAAVREAALDHRRQAVDVVDLLAGQPQARRILAGGELQGQ